MIKKVFSSFIFVFALVFNLLIHAEDFSRYPLKCAPEFRYALERVQRIPEVEDMLAKVLQEGPLNIQRNKYLSEQFQGYWSDSERTIYLTKKGTSSDCMLVLTLLFELHNAYRNSDLRKVDRLALHNQIERKDYIEAIEYIEYQNVLSTSNFLAQGVQQGHFPPNCYWRVDDNFPDHFSNQQSNGHSAFIGKGYDQLTRNFFKRTNPRVWKT